MSWPNAINHPQNHQKCMVYTVYTPSPNGRFMPLGFPDYNVWIPPVSGGFWVFSLGWPHYGSRPMNDSSDEHPADCVCRQGINTPNCHFFMGKNDDQPSKCVLYPISDKPRCTSCFDVKTRLVVRGFRSTAKQALSSLSARASIASWWHTSAAHAAPHGKSKRRCLKYTQHFLQGFQSNHQFRPQSALRLRSFRDFSFRGLFPTCARWLSQSAGSCQCCFWWRIKKSQLTKLTLPDIDNLAQHTKHTKHIEHSKHPNKLNMLNILNIIDTPLLLGLWGCPDFHRVCSENALTLKIFPYVVPLYHCTPMELYGVIWSYMEYPIFVIH